MNPLTRTLRAYAADARSALRGAPVEILLGVLLAAAASISLRDRSFGEETWPRVMAAVALALPLVFTATVLHARGVIGAGARWGLTAASLAVATVAGALGFDPAREASGWRLVLLVGAAVCGLALASVPPRATGYRRRTWAFVYRTLLRAAGLVAYAGALWIVLAGAVAAVVSLFELRDPKYLYGDLAAWLFCAVVPWLFAGGLPRLVAEDDVGGAPLVLSRLGRWLYAPVLVIYLAILYAYAVRVLVTGELPKNLVSPLVLAAGVLGFVGAALLEPVHADPEERGLSLLARWIPALLLPLVPLAAWALLARLGQYGWTEFRYVRAGLLLCLGVLGVLGTLRAVRRRPPLLAAVPAVLGTMLLLAAVGPWSATAVSRRDQTVRLRDALYEADVDPGRLPGDTVTLDSALFHRIGGGADYLRRVHGIRALRRLVPNAPDTTGWVHDYARLLGLREGCRPRGPQRVRARLAWGRGVPGVRGGVMVAVGVTEGAPRRVPVAGGEIELRLAGDRVTAAGPGWRAEAALGSLRGLLEARLPAGCGPEWQREDLALPAGAALLPLTDPAGTVRAQIVVEHAVFGTALPAPRREAPGRWIREVHGLLLVP